MVQLTELEKDALRKIGQKCNPDQVSNAIASLVKKGLIWSDGKGANRTIGLTWIGKTVYSKI